VNTAKIILENLPLYPTRFDILKIESKKKEKFLGARRMGRPQLFGVSDMGSVGTWGP
jgi:hypothetical protein